jgi:hypothetical protein
MREKAPRPAHAALHLVENQERAGLIAQIAQALQALVGHHTDAAFALDRLDHHGAGAVGDRRADRVVVGPFQMREPRHQRAIALDHLLGPRRRDGPGGPAMERALEGDDLHPFGLAVLIVELPRHLDRKLGRLGAGVGEEHCVGKGAVDQQVSQPLLFRNTVDVRHMPKLARLFGQRRHQRGVACPSALTAMPPPRSR